MCLSSMISKKRVCSVAPKAEMGDVSIIRSSVILMGIVGGVVTD